MSALRRISVEGKMYDFPAEMSNEEIKVVLDKKFGSKPTAPPPAPEATPEAVEPVGGKPTGVAAELEVPIDTNPPQEVGEPPPPTGLEPAPVVKEAQHPEESQIASDEGSRKNSQGKHISYLDSVIDKKTGKGHPTGGIGHLLSKKEIDLYPEGSVIPQSVVDKWFEEDVKEAELDVQVLLPDAPEDVKNILTNMAFQLGREGLRKFKKTIKLLKDGDYQEASKEMLDSAWFKSQTPNRAKRLAKRMEAFGKEHLAERGRSSNELMKDLAKIDNQRNMLKLFSDNPDLTFNEMKEGGVFDETIEQELF